MPRTDKNLDPVAPLGDLWHLMFNKELPSQIWHRTDGLATPEGNTSVEDVGLPCVMDSSEWHGPQGMFTYQINRDGFVGPEFHHNSDILALGCSVTASCGLPHEYSWPHILGKYTGKKVNVLAYPGSGLMRCVMSVLPMMNKFGPPKEILALLPDFERLHIYRINTDNNQPHLPPWEQANICYDDYNRFFTEPATSERDHSRPLKYKDATGKIRDIPVDAAISSNMMALKFLSDLCKMLGIELKVATWHERTWRTLGLMDYPHYIRGPEDSPHVRGNVHVHASSQQFCTNECHRPVHRLQKELWEEASDRPNGHPGVHAHVHFAEVFLGEHIDQKFIADIVEGPRRKR